MQRELKAPILRITETRGNTVETSNMQTTPIGRAFQLQLPFANVTWHRPLAVEVHQDGSTYRLPIYNTTSRAISIIFFTGLATVLVPFVIRTILLRRRIT
jgi:hypothetical protein